METREEFIKKIFERYKQVIARNQNEENQIKLTEKLNYYEAFFSGKIQNVDFEDFTYNFFDLFNHIINRNPIPFQIDSKELKSIIKPWQETNYLKHVVVSFITNILLKSKNTENDFNTNLSFLYEQNFKDSEIINFCLSSNNRSIYFIESTENLDLSPFGNYLNSIIQSAEPQKGFFGVFQKKQPNRIIDAIIKKALSENNNYSNFKFQTFQFLLQLFPDSLIEQYSNFIKKVDNNDNNKIILDVESCLLLLDYDTKFKEIILEEIKKLKPNKILLFPIYKTLYQKLNLYKEKLDEIINLVFKEKAIGNQEYNDYRLNNLIDIKTKYNINTEVCLIKHLLEEDRILAIKTIKQYNKISVNENSQFQSFLDQEFGQECIDLVIDAIYKNPKNNYPWYHEEIFNIIGKYDFNSVKEKIWDFAENFAGKKQIEIATNTLAQLGERIMEYSKIKFDSEKNEAKIIAAIVLGKINSKESLQLLREKLDFEKNDEIRDILVSALSDSIYSVQFSKLEIQEMIDFAESRGKLNKYSEKLVKEIDLEDLFWKIDGDKLNQKELRFLFYRIARTKGVNSDIEARQLMNALDKSKSVKFAKQLIKAFMDSGAEAKNKYYLTTAGKLGGNEVLTTIYNFFKKCIVENRTKMAECSVEALGLIGTNRALRHIDVISRKFQDKKPVIFETSKKVLEAAATELNISLEELSDRIIPDFDFQGLYKSFEIENESYRAFINSDFSVCFFDEGNNIKKSLPKSASTELKTEVKEIQKELKEVVKNLNGKLEKFLFEEKRWTHDAWQSFFQEHPIMFVYARKLIWGIFDKDEKLKETFYCSDDTSLYNIEDEEVELNVGDFIGIIHPIYLDKDLLNKWKDKLYEMSFITIIPQLDRKIFFINENEKENNISYRFNNLDIPKGADFVSSNFDKLGWIKSNGDGGRLEITKRNSKIGISANIYIEGLYAWYQGGEAKATVHDVTFIGKSWSDKVLIKDVPPLFYSETMADIDYLINA